MPACRAAFSCSNRAGCSPRNQVPCPIGPIFAPLTVVNIVIPPFLNGILCFILPRDDTDTQGHMGVKFIGEKEYKWGEKVGGMITADSQTPFGPNPKGKSRGGKNPAPGLCCGKKERHEQVVSFFGGRYRTWTCDLPHVNPDHGFFLTIFAYLWAFLLQNNCFPLLLKHELSGGSGAVCGWLCGQIAKRS